jgi:hypothetical protein
MRVIGLDAEHISGVVGRRSVTFWHGKRSGAESAARAFCVREPS